MAHKTIPLGTTRYNELMQREVEQTVTISGPSHEELAHRDELMASSGYQTPPEGMTDWNELWEWFGEHCSDGPDAFLCHISLQHNESTAEAYVRTDSFVKSVTGNFGFN